MKDSEMMLAAAGIIRERGLCKKVLGEPNGQVCAMGALNVVHHGFSSYLHGECNSQRSFYTTQRFRVASYVANFCSSSASSWWSSDTPHGVLVDTNNCASSTVERIASLFELAADCRRIEELQEDEELGQEVVSASSSEGTKQAPCDKNYDREPAV